MSVPPGPSSSPMEQTAAFVNEPEAFLRQSYEDYGACFTIRLAFMPPMVVVAAPDLIEGIFKNKTDYDGGAGNRATGVDEAMGSTFLMALDGHAHRKMQRQLKSLLNAGVEHFGNRIRAATLERLAEWSLRDPVSLREEMQLLALELAADLMIGPERSERRRRILGLLKSMLDTTVSDDRPNMLGALLGFWPLRQRVFEEFDRIIEAHRRCSESNSVLDGLLAAAEEEYGTAYDSQTLREQLLSMCVAGHDSTAASLAWALDFILRDRETLSWIRDDCAAIATAEQINQSLLNAVPHLESVIRESMRLRPVAPFVNRMTNKRVRLAGFELPAQTVVCPCMILAHTDQSVGSMPQQFVRDRFLEGKPSNASNFPFGGGARYCIGETLGLAELKVVLAIVLTARDITLIDPPPRIGRRGFVLAPDNAVRARVTWRSTL